LKTAQYKKEYCQELIEHMSQGYSYASFAHITGNGRTTLYDWEKVYPEWKLAKQIGESASLYHYEKLKQAKLSGKEGNEELDARLIDTAVLIFTLKTRFHYVYGEKIKIESEEEEGKVFRLAYKLKGDA
jgi:DNA-binding XRE family transcriptional regulator